MPSKTMKAFAFIILSCILLMAATTVIDAAHQITGLLPLANGGTGNAGSGGGILVGTATCTTFGTAGGICPVEGTAPTNVSGAAPIYPDSTKHEYMAATNGASTYGMMIRAQPGSIHTVAQTATITNTTLCAASAGACNIAGTYRVTWVFTQTGTACGTPAPGGLNFSVGYTDFNGGVHAAAQLPMASAASGTATTLTALFTAANNTFRGYGTAVLTSNGAAAITYTVTYTACGAGTGTYEVDAVTERLI